MQTKDCKNERFLFFILEDIRKVLNIFLALQANAEDMELLCQAFH